MSFSVSLGFHPSLCLPNVAYVALQAKSEPGAFKCRGMDKYILSPAILTNKTKSLFGLVDLNGPHTFLGLAKDLGRSGRASLRRILRRKIQIDSITSVTSSPLGPWPIRTLMWAP